MASREQPQTPLPEARNMLTGIGRLPQAERLLRSGRFILK